jgi:hypothetical protein
MQWAGLTVRNSHRNPIEPILRCNAHSRCLLCAERGYSVMRVRLPAAGAHTPLSLQSTAAGARYFKRDPVTRIGHERGRALAMSSKLVMDRKRL